MIAGPDDGPAIVLIGSLGTTLNMWEPQIAAFSVDHRVVAVDLPGHGGTPTPARPPTVASYAEEVIALLDAHGIDLFSVVGLSFGGAVAQVLAARHPHRATSAVIAASAPAFDAAFWRARAMAVRRDGMAAILDLTSRRRFSETFRHAHPDVAAASYANSPPWTPRAMQRVVRRSRHSATRWLTRSERRRWSSLGADDVVTPPRLAREIARLIGTARLRVIPQAGHLVSLEEPELFNGAVRGHIAAVTRRPGAFTPTALS
jgi:pimeloyl-ACP methyl ester carboxylesterase